MKKGSLLSFVPVRLEDKPTVDKYMGQYGQCSCQHCFAALYTLYDKYGSELCERDGFLFTLRKKLCEEGKRVYLAPMGGGDLKAAYSVVLEDAAAHGCKAAFNTVTREHVDFLKKNFPGRFKYTELRDCAEYIYLFNSLYRMEGSNLADKRTEVRHILRTYEDRIELRYIPAEKVSDVWEFEQKWFSDNLSSHDELAMTLKKSSVKKQLDNFDALDTLCIGAYLDGEMVGYNYGVALNKNCFDGMVIKARRDIPNLYALMYWGMSCLCAGAFTYFNWEEDLGSYGLRHTKMHYCPAVLMKKYLVEETEEPSSSEESDAIPVVSSIELYPGEELIPSKISIFF